MGAVPVEAWLIHRHADNATSEPDYVGIGTGEAIHGGTRLERILEGTHWGKFYPSWCQTLLMHT